MVQLLSFRCKLLYVVEVLSLIARENHGPVRFGGPDCAGRVNELGISKPQTGCQTVVL